MMENIEYKELSLENICDNLLDSFNRYQKVTKCWINKNGNWTLTDEEYIVDWDKTETGIDGLSKERVIKLLSNVIDKNLGYVFGAYKDGKLIGFSILLNNRFGSKRQYIALKSLHVSLDYRKQGIGRRLLELSVEKARQIGIEKIYISANDSVDTIRFYFNFGCVDAMEINKEITDDDSYDRPLEYVIQYENKLDLA
jgi:predicted N-acetyltransferase YhbS